MFSAKDIAAYFICKDKNKKIFNFKVININNRTLYEGNLKLNKYLFLSQVLYLAKNNNLLFEDEFVAYDNGPVIKQILTDYAKMTCNNNEVVVSPVIKDFLDKIYVCLENATSEELVEITHEDPEWKKLSSNTYNAPTMNIKSHVDEYKKRYKGILEALSI